MTNDSKVSEPTGRLNLAVTHFEEDTAIDLLHDTTAGNWPYNAELRQAVADAIRRFPNTEAQWWIGPEAVLGAVEKFLTERGEARD